MIIQVLKMVRVIHISAPPIVTTHKLSILKSRRSHLLSVPVLRIRHQFFGESGTFEGSEAWRGYFKIYIDIG